MPAPRKALDSAGFSLVEVLVAAAILVIGLVPLSAAINSGLKSMTAADQSLAAAILLERAAEEAKAAPFDDLSSLRAADFGGDLGEKGYSLERSVTDAPGMAGVKRVRITISRGNRLLAQATFLIHRRGV